MNKKTSRRIDSRPPQPFGRSQTLFGAFLLFMLIAWAQGVGADGFQAAAPGYRFRFPYDHGAHEDFRTEWWYVTGHLTTVSGDTYGYELTFFRLGNRDPHVTSNPSRWAIHQLYFSHFALTDLRRQQFRYWEKISREALGKAGAETGRLAVHIDDWRVEAQGEKIVLTASEEDVDLRLELSAEKPPAIHGIEGVSRKGPRPEEASHYYSITRLRTGGSLRIHGTTEAVRGWSWMDHEFFSSPDEEDGPPKEDRMVGWDWFSIQLDNRIDLMFFRLRLADGRISPYSSGSLIDTQGAVHALSGDTLRLTPVRIWTSPKSGGKYPVAWRVEIPEKEAHLELIPRLSDQELITRESTQVIYWEGAMHIVGRWQGQPVTGEGYLEMTGYAALKDRYRRSGIP